jgi:hypothetical protein
MSVQWVRPKNYDPVRDLLDPNLSEYAAADDFVDRHQVGIIVLLVVLFVLIFGVQMAEYVLNHSHGEPQVYGNVEP